MQNMGNITYAIYGYHYVCDIWITLCIQNMGNITYAIYGYH